MSGHRFLGHLNPKNLLTEMQIDPMGLRSLRSIITHGIIVSVIKTIVIISCGRVLT